MIDGWGKRSTWGMMELKESRCDVRANGSEPEDTDTGDGPILGGGDATFQGLIDVRHG